MDFFITLYHWLIDNWFGFTCGALFQLGIQWRQGREKDEQV